MPPEADLDVDDPGTAEPGKEVEGLKAALQATRQRAQASEGRQRDLETTVAELRGRLDGLTAGAGAAKTAAKTYSRAELNQMVKDETISEEQADQVWEKQTEDRITAKVTQQVSAQVDGTTRAGRIGAEISRYTAAIKDLGDADSENRKKVQKAFDRLVANGHRTEKPEDKMLTELTALEIAFGDVSALESGTKPREREPFKETGGRGEGEGGDDAAGWPKDMPAAKRTYYQDLINKGAYTKESAISEFRYKPKYGPRRGKAA